MMFAVIVDETYATNKINVAQAVEVPPMPVAEHGVAPEDMSPE